MTAKEQTCCFTGLRNIPLLRLPQLKKHLLETIEEQIKLIIPQLSTELPLMRYKQKLHGEAIKEEPLI